MAVEKSTLARPHAQALYAVVRTSDRVPGWSALLQQAAQAFSMPSVASLCNHPKADCAFWVSLFQALPAHAQVDALVCERFVGTLFHFSRMHVVAEIRQQFDALWRADEGRLKGRVSSALPLTPEQQTDITQALSKRLGCPIDLEISDHPSLLAGLIVQIEDTVWDGSLRHRLKHIAEQLMRA